jgi:hypothetical protein
MRHNDWLSLCAVSLCAIASIASARAATITQDFDVSGTASGLDIVYISSGSVSEFNPALGTLTGVTIGFSGTATNTGSSFDNFIAVSNGAVPNVALVEGNGFTDSPGSFSISASGTDTFAFGLTGITGLSTTDLDFGFTDDTTMTSQTGTLTYDYTPTPTPEPASAVLLLTGFLGLRAVRRRR